MADFVFTRINPTTNLEKIIQHYWVGEVRNEPDRIFTHVAIAQSKAQILIHYEGEFHTSTNAPKTEKRLVAGFYGPSLLPQQYFSSSNKAAIFGIQLSPSAIPALLSMPASEVANQSVALVDVLGHRSKELEEKLLAAKTGEEKARVASSFFENRLRHQYYKYQGVEHAVAYIHCRKGQVSIPSLIQLSCLSPRQFERNFKELTGFSAQTYLRVIRFENAIQAATNSAMRLIDIALAGGYYDQAHFNRDFKLFTGLTPHQYFAIHAPGVE